MDRRVPSEKLNNLYDKPVHCRVWELGMQLRFFQSQTVGEDYPHYLHVEHFAASRWGTGMVE
jgi:hypothetical protein